jgi:two-component system response regulator LytT
MNVLIIEDEPPIAEDIKEMSCSILSSRLSRIDIVHTLNEAEEFLKHHTIDLCLLDLNLKGRDGYELLNRAVAGAFHTIIISAHTEQAHEAFQFGVLDFVPKPVERDRLRRAFDLYLSKQEGVDASLKYLVVRKQRTNHLISVDEILYFQAEGYLVRMFLKTGKPEYIEKPLNRLVQILPKKFVQVHRSCIVALEQIASYRHKGGGVYELTLKDGTTLPLSPSMVKTLDQLTHRSDRNPL